MSEEASFRPMKADEIRDWIEFIRKKFRKIKKRIRKGDYLPKGNSYYIFVDDTDIVMETFGSIGGISWKKINRHFAHRLTKSAAIGASNEYYEENGFDYKKVKAMKLSELIKNRVGECTEMATVVQILAQHYGKESYWVDGSLYRKGEDSDHVYNIVLKDDKFYLLDAAMLNVVPIRHIDRDEDGFIVITPAEKLKNEASYCLH